MEEEKKGHVEFLHTRRGRALSVALLAVCAVALFKPLGLAQYFLFSTPFAVPALFLSCILPTLAAFIAGPVGAVIVAACAVCPRIILYPFYYPPDPAIFFANGLEALGNFAESAVFACVFYSMGKRGGAKNLLCGLLCGGLDFMFIQIFSGSLVVLLIEKNPPISALPSLLAFLAALTAHAVVFLLQRGERAARRE